MRFLLPLLSLFLHSVFASQFILFPGISNYFSNVWKKTLFHNMGARSEISEMGVTCLMCHMGTDTVMKWIKDGDSRDLVVNKAVTLCVSFGIQQRHVCKGAIEAHIDTLMFLEATKRDTEHPVTKDDVCYLALYPECPLPGPHYEWTIDLDFLGPKPDLPQEPAPPAEETMQILHITDAHIDLEYTPGNKATCRAPACCRSDSGVASNEVEAAGYWGDYRDCDSPPHAFTDLVQQVAKTHPDVAYIAYTGDTVPHSMWATSVEANTKVVSSAMKQLKEAFPGKMVLPVLGNHESHPFNTFSVETPKAEIPDNVSTTWLYKLAQDEWGLGEENSATIGKGGYYAIEVKPGLLVIGINNNFCYNYNWWQMLDSSDPAGQLKWLAETLLNAEKQGQKVHNLAHVPGNSISCLSHWRKLYQKIIHRFESTVVAQFHGHDHTDYFTLFYDPEDKTRATSVGFIAGSATPYSHVNPNYRVYTAEAQGNFRVLDHETWSYNLTEANLAGSDVPPNWKKLYSFNEAYGTTSMLPADLDAFVIKLAASEELLDKFYRHHVREADSALAKGCDPKCRRKMVCDMITPDPEDKSKCDALAAQGELLRTISEIYEAELYAEEAKEAKEKEEREKLEREQLAGMTETSQPEEINTEAAVPEAETTVSETEVTVESVVQAEVSETSEPNIEENTGEAQQEEVTTENIGESEATVEITNNSVESVLSSEGEVTEEKSAKMVLAKGVEIQNDEINNMENITKEKDNKNTPVENSTESTEVTQQDTEKETLMKPEETSDMPETRATEENSSESTTESSDSWTFDSEAETIKMDGPMLKQQFMEVLHGPENAAEKALYLETRTAASYTTK